MLISKLFFFHFVPAFIKPFFETPQTSVKIKTFVIFYEKRTLSLHDKFEVYVLITATYCSLAVA